MIVSTKGRYALRVMVDLAENANGEFLSIKDVAERQGISVKYLEQILPILTQSGLIQGRKGMGGGYRLTRKPEKYTVGEILRETEGDLAPVACLECGAKPCPNKKFCPTLMMWKEFHAITYAYFDSISLNNLLQRQPFERRLDFTYLPYEMAAKEENSFMGAVELPPEV